MNHEHFPHPRPSGNHRERIHSKVKTALTEKPTEEVKAESYEEFACELARVQRGQTTVFGTMRVVNQVRDKWLRRGLYWPTVSRIMDLIVSLPFEMNPKTSG
jgi:hypothetical protein